MLDAAISLQFNTVETIWRPTTTRPSTSVWKMILMKSCQSMLEGKIYSSSCSWKRRGGPDGRAANSLKNIKTFFSFPLIFLFGFLLSLPRAKLYLLSRCELVLIFVKKADYSSSIRIWSKCSYTGRPQGKSLDRSPVPCTQFGQIVGELAFDGHDERLSRGYHHIVKVWDIKGNLILKMGYIFCVFLIGGLPLGLIQKRINPGICPRGSPVSAQMVIFTGTTTTTTTTKLKNQWMMDIWTNFEWFHPFSVFHGDWRFGLWGGVPLCSAPSIWSISSISSGNNNSSTRWPTSVRPTTSNVPNWVDSLILLQVVLLIIRSCLCVCARQTMERRGSQFAQDRKWSSQEPFFPSCRRRPSSFISLLSLSLHSSLISIRTFNQNSIQLLRRRRRKTKWFWCVCVSEVISCLLFSSKLDGLASTIRPGATWLRIHPVYIAADYLPTVSFYFCVSAAK